MKRIIGLVLILMSLNTFSSTGIMIQCWHKGEVQSLDNIVYQNGSDGGYINGGSVLYDGFNIDFLHPDAGIVHSETRSEYTESLSRRDCQETISFYDGDTITLELKFLSTFNNGTDAFEGYMYEVEIHEVFCKRREF